MTYMAQHLLAYAIIGVLALACMYYIGYNQGFDDGEKVGRIDALFEKNGITLNHNGVKQ